MWGGGCWALQCVQLPGPAGSISALVFSEVLKELVQSTVLCVLFLVAVSLPAPARPQPHFYQRCFRATQHCWPLKWCRDNGRCWHCPPGWHSASLGLLFWNAQANSDCWTLGRVEWCLRAPQCCRQWLCSSCNGCALLGKHKFSCVLSQWAVRGLELLRWCRATCRSLMVARAK